MSGLASGGSVLLAALLSHQRYPTEASLPVGAIARRCACMRSDLVSWEPVYESCLRGVSALATGGEG